VPENPDANWRVTRLQRGNAKRLRRAMTDAERVIWYAVRANRAGLSLRRQSPIGPYIVDFVCHAAGLVIEIDGSQHLEGKGLAYDKRRDAFLASRGLRVLRFTNLDVLTNRDGVLEALFAALRGSPSPTSPASAGRENRVALQRLSGSRS
jgi:very-short-patch-repair endonuclease